MITKDMVEFLFLVGVGYMVVYYALMLIVPTLKSYLNFVLDREVQSYEDKAFTIHTIRNVLKMFGMINIERNFTDNFTVKHAFFGKVRFDGCDLMMIGIFPPIAVFSAYCLSILILTTQVGSMILVSLGGFLGLSFMVRYSIVSAKQQMRKHVEKYHEK